MIDFDDNDDNDDNDDFFCDTNTWAVQFNTCEIAKELEEKVEEEVISDEEESECDGDGDEEAAEK